MSLVSDIRQVIESIADEGLAERCIIALVLPRLSLRAAILERDGYACVYCGAKPEDHDDLEIDHVIPKSKGGRGTRSNLVTACKSCNTRKSNHLLVDGKIP